MKPPMTPQDIVKNGKVDHDALRQHFDKFVKVLNKIGFGSSTPENGAVSVPALANYNAIIDRDSNMEGNKFIIHFPAAANTDITIIHNLGRIPVGWIPLRMTNAGVIYIGSVAPTATNITLRETVGGQIAILHFI